MAQRVGFEPTVLLPVHLISSQGRYNHFDTAAYLILLCYYKRCASKNQGRIFSHLFIFLVYNFI